MCISLFPSTLYGATKWQNQRYQMGLLALAVTGKWLTFVFTDEQCGCCCLTWSLPLSCWVACCSCCCCFFFTSCSADLISSSVTPCVDRRVSLTRLACALRCVSLSSSRTGGTNDLPVKRNLSRLLVNNVASSY